MPVQTETNVQASSVLAWILENGFVNETGKPLEFTKHRFLIDYMSDNHPLKVTKKAAQIGLTVAETLASFHLAKFYGLTTIHTLQTQDVIKGFVFPKVNPIIERNAEIKKSIKLDSESLKRVGDAFIYYRGAQSESQAINISADILNIDEYDRSNQQIVEMYQSRLDASEYKWKRYFSNPSAVGFGVDFLYAQSNQYHWFIKCPHCGWDWYLDFLPSDEKNHYVDIKKAIYACGKCHGVLIDAARISGRWVAKYPTRDSHGYWFSQLMAPWISAQEIVQKQQTNTIDYFYNFVLGKAYTPSDLLVDRSTILRANSPSAIAKTNVAIGVDNGVEKHWVAMTPEGVFDYGHTQSWDEIERIKLMYNAIMIIDANPYPVSPKALTDKYSGEVYINYYNRDSKDLGIIRWGTGDNTGVVYSDRTKILDLIAQEIGETKLLFRQSPSKLEDFIYHCSNVYRTTEEDTRGIVRGVWKHQENKPDHYFHALAYARIGLEKTMSSSSASYVTGGEVKKDLKDFVDGDQLITDIGTKIEEAYDKSSGNDDWKYS